MFGGGASLPPLLPVTRQIPGRSHLHTARTVAAGSADQVDRAQEAVDAASAVPGLSLDYPACGSTALVHAVDCIRDSVAAFLLVYMLEAVLVRRTCLVDPDR